MKEPQRKRNNEKKIVEAKVKVENEKLHTRGRIWNKSVQEPRPWGRQIKGDINLFRLDLQIKAQYASFPNEKRYIIHPHITSHNIP